MSDDSAKTDVRFTASFVTHAMSQPTVQLRFMGGRLQQGFEITTYRDSVPVSREIEWRDVPSIPEPTTPITKQEP